MWVTGLQDPALQDRPSVWTSSGPGKGLLRVLEKMVGLAQTRGPLWTRPLALGTRRGDPSL